MSDTEPIVPFRLRTSDAAAEYVEVRPANQQASQRISFDRRELMAILDIYGRMVAEGEWRDYAIDHERDKAVFSIFRRASEVPLFRIEKAPRLSRKKGLYSVVTQGGIVLRRGQDLSQVLRVLGKQPKLVSV